MFLRVCITEKVVNAEHGTDDRNQEGYLGNPTKATAQRVEQ
jgi:hypothetical protein